MKLIVPNNYLVTILGCLLLPLTNCKTDKLIPPVLNSVEPTRGIIGDPITIKGENIENANSFMFNNITSLITQNTTNAFLSVVPSKAEVGVNDLTVQTDGGTSNKLQFEVIKEPDHVDLLPPAIEKTIPAANYIDYPILIYGDNLSGIIDITFNDKPATIFTNNKRVVTTTIPKGLSTGLTVIKIKTKKGTSSINFQVLGPPPNGVSPVNFSIVNIPPSNYVQSISNNWSCGLFSDQGDKSFVDLNSNDGNDSFIVTGRFEYHFDIIQNYNDLNYVEFTNKETGETLAGQFSSTSVNPCIFNMVLISSKTGKISFCTFDRRNNEPDLNCDN
jgi:hypothetical protein